MSLKYKMLAMMVIVFFTNIIILILFFQFYSIPFLTDGIERHQKEAEALTGEIAALIDGGDIMAGLQVLREYTEQDTQIKFELTNVLTREQIYIPEQQGAFWGFATFETVELSGEPYTLFFKRDMGIISSIDGTLYRITVLELIVFSIAFVICGAIMHARYVRPILRLKNETVSFLKSGTKLKPSKRTDELGELENSFYRMTEGLIEEKAKQDRIIASISHDIKTPLTSILGFAERLIKKDLNKDKQTSYLKNIYTQGKNIESIIEDFDEYLNYSMDRSLALKNIEISFLYELLQDEYMEICTEQGVVLNIINECPQGAAVDIDIAKIRRVFANLIGNAIRHNAGTRLEIQVVFAQFENGIKVTVADNGAGVSEAELPHIFEPFFTSDKSRKVSGLGLSICKQIIAAHDGTINGNNGNNGFIATVNLPKRSGLPSS
jgi:signal transduction histidine kinase